MSTETNFSYSQFGDSQFPDSQYSRMSFPSLRDGSHEQGIAQAQARGHAAGYAAGLHAASAEIELLKSELHAKHAAAIIDEQARVSRSVAILQASAQALDERSLPLLAEVQDALAAAALDLAEAAIGYELCSTSNSARSALSRATALIDPKVAHTVRMNPDDLAALDDATRISAVEFVADPSLPRGDAITEFPDGYLDARIHTALARAKDALLGGAL